MNVKSLITAAAIAASAAGFSASQANADVDIGIGFMIDGPGLVVSGGTHGFHGWHDDWNYGISCGEGRWIVKNHGYYKVKKVECNGKYFTYTGKMSGDKYEIKVKRSNGAITSVSML